MPRRLLFPTLSGEEVVERHFMKHSLKKWAPVHPFTGGFQKLVLHESKRTGKTGSRKQERQRISKMVVKRNPTTTTGYNRLVTHLCVAYGRRTGV